MTRNELTSDRKHLEQNGTRSRWTESKNMAEFKVIMSKNIVTTNKHILSMFELREMGERLNGITLQTLNKWLSKSTTDRIE